jgi:hypothetical protein
MKLRSVYHTPKGERGIGKWIVGWTWFLALFYGKGKALKYNYSHEELWIPDEKGNFSKVDRTEYYDNKCHGVCEACCDQEFIDKISSCPTGQCFSSTTRGDSNGVRFAPASEVLGKHPDRWEYVEFEVDEDYFKYMLLPDMEAKVGNEYDFVAVGTGFVTPVLVDDKEKDYCSGICCWAKWVLLVLPVLWKRISPRRSAMIMAKKYHEPKPI